MKQLSASKIVRAVDTLRKDGRSVVFNDRLQDGGRSFKVWGWTDVDYAECMGELVGRGFLVIPVTTPVKGYGWAATGGNRRLHVYEGE